MFFKICYVINNKRFFDIIFSRKESSSWVDSPFEKSIQGGGGRFGSFGGVPGLLFLMNIDKQRTTIAAQSCSV